MKFKTHLIFVIIPMLSCILSYAQVPQLFNYQGIARDTKGNPMSDQTMSLKLSILPLADALIPEYEETQIVRTNEFGLYTLHIGNGAALKGQMKTVKWETGNKYIKVQIDPDGGANFMDAGTSQLLSVPYALYAAQAGITLQTDNDNTRSGTVTSNATHVAGDVNYLTKFSAFNTIGKSLLFDNGTSVGLGTSTPAAGTKLHLLTTTGNIEHIRMQNTNSTGFGKFLMYNDNAANYATFTKYGSAYAGGYTGVASQYPYANLLAFGNNNGAFILANSGNIGIGLVSAGVTNLKFNANQSTGYLGLGGSFIPAANVHINNGATGDTLRISNATTGHLNTDGLEIRTTGNAASVMNRENATLSLGTNNNPVINLTNTGSTELTGTIKIAGGNPGMGKVLTSDGNGLGTWQNSAVPNGNNFGDMQFWNGTAWVLVPVGLPGQILQLSQNNTPTWSGTPLQIGQNYQGGIIAYILQPGDIGYNANVTHGLIISTANLADAIWGCGAVTTGALGTGIGTGQQNTQQILNAGCTITPMAATACDNLIAGGYSDWYLPSKDELSNIFFNQLALGGFVGGPYWTSTESLNIGMAVAQAPGANAIDGYKDLSSYHVRAIRSF